jgi:hypothetical protein
MTTMKATGLIIGGKVVPCSRPVFNWNDHGMEFKPGDGARKRVPKALVDLFVWHWTGGTGSMEGLFSTLHHRDPPLGIEFGIDREGDIYQFADPILVDTYDAGSYNPRSVGCEVSNYGFMGDPRKPVPARERDRGTYQMIMNGKPRTFARFYPEQIKAAIALGAAVSDAIPSIPKCIPCTSAGILYPNMMKTARLKAYSGHLGHFHLTNKKSDPGCDLLGSMLGAGFRAEVV